jgi:predicted  nucleic acid-binding Zn-ribbon protein
MLVAQLKEKEELNSQAKLKYNKLKQAYKGRILKLEAQLQALRVSSAEKNALQVSKNSELQAEKERADSLESQLKDVSQQLEAAKGEQSSTATTVAQQKAELDGLRAQLADTNANKSDLENEIKALKNSLKNKNSDKTIVVNALSEKNNLLIEANKNIAELNKQIQELQNSISKNEGLQDQLNDFILKLSAANSKIAALEQEIDQLKSQKSDLESRLQKSEDDKAGLQRKIDKMNTKLKEKEKSLEEERAKVTDLNKEIGLLKVALSNSPKQENQNAKNTKIAQLEQTIAELTAARASNSKKYQDDLGSLEQSLESTKGIVVKQSQNIQNRNTKIQEQNRQLSDQMKLNEDLRAKIQSLNENIKRVENDSKSLLQTEQEKTKIRLQNLLSWVLIDPDLAEEAQQYIYEGSNMSNSEIQKIFSKDVCEFFMYLDGLVKVQSKLLIPIYDVFDKRDKDKYIDDIFKLYRTSDERIDSDPDVQFQLLQHISDIFQKFFSDIETAKLYQILSGSDYPILNTVLKNYDTSKSVKLTVLSIELKKYGELSKYVIQPSKNATNEIEIADISTKRDVDEPRIPLVILGIKFIQLLGQVLKSKYKIQERCGVTSATSM